MRPFVSRLWCVPFIVLNRIGPMIQLASVRVVSLFYGTASQRSGRQGKSMHKKRSSRNAPYGRAKEMSAGIRDPPTVSATYCLPSRR